MAPLTPNGLTLRKKTISTPASEPLPKKQNKKPQLEGKNPVFLTLPKVNLRENLFDTTSVK